MRYIYLLLVVLFVSSCAHNRIRLRKVDKHDRVVQIEQKKTDTRTSHKQEIIVAEELTSSNETETSNETVSKSKSELGLGQDIEEAPIALDADELEDEINEEPSNGRKLQQAIHAETDARKAKNAFIWSLSMFFVFFIPFVPLFSIIPFIIGTIRLSRSNKSNYITLEGERDARTARILQLIYGVLALLSIILIAAILILIFL